MDPAGSCPRAHLLLLPLAPHWVGMSLRGSRVGITPLPQCRLCLDIRLLSPSLSLSEGSLPQRGQSESTRPWLVCMALDGDPEVTDAEMVYNVLKCLSSMGACLSLIHCVPLGIPSSYLSAWLEVSVKSWKLSSIAKNLCILGPLLTFVAARH